MSGLADPVPAVRAFLRSRKGGQPSWLDRYTALFGLAVAAAVLAQPASSAFAAVTRQSDPARAAAGAALIMLAYAGLLVVTRAAGPVAVPAADAAWLVLSPLDRRGVLGRTAGLLAAVSLPAGIVLGVGVLAVLGSPDGSVVRLITAVVLGLAASAGGMAVAVLAQASQTWSSWLQATVVVTVLLAAAVALLGSGAGRRLLAAASAPVPYGMALAGASAMVAALLVRRAWASLGDIPARTVLAASSRVGHVATAAAGMEPGALTWIAEDNHWRGRLLRSRRWPALPAPSAQAWQDWRRLSRRPGRLAAMLGTSLLPFLVARATGGLGPLTAAVVITGALAVAAAGTSGARRDGDNPALARLLGVGFREGLAARAVLPVLLSAGWLTLALGGLALEGALTSGPWWLLGPAAAPAVAAGALRTARRRPVDHSMPVIDTPGGAIPTGPLLWAVTGVDLATLGCVPLLLALTVQRPVPEAFPAGQVLLGAAVLSGYLFRARRDVR
ncbi:DUF6297 family protein [Streptosporangium sp. NBC_01639]|uniref:DUF6297 family protein n=1 Tax=Streptosporangium sp. NBC_01639 TaxID=2975948 RepID=UPI003867642E|nr:DUF6297 family protein [Streptosporangium sp. NBC_01639]